ncbi:MAG: NAD(P)/FAD-dependent oxidoreductase [Candidatus Dormibacteraeota bacterium]|nr:NAD(P)/FAD-dependent oxidoreductase [Candidatus Dormibacteraeota bacterium]
MYDAIVVGARCAGSPTAMLLARRGYRVLLLDRDAFPSDHMSTHWVHQRGVASLERWGLRRRLAATGCPPITSITMDVGPFALRGTPPPADGVAEAYCARRTVLDGLLVDAAVDAGAELRERFSVQSLVWDGDRVSGVAGRSAGGTAVTERAPIVIGADGVHSLVARQAGAPTYNTKPTFTCAYYSYWSGLPLEGVEFYPRERRGFGALPTHGGLTCIIVGWPHHEFHAFRADIESNFLRTLELAPEFAARVREGTREERFTGTAELYNHFRRPYGPGWALVGDAGYHKDSITAQGITDAFRDAEQLAGAVDAGLSGARPIGEAMAEYERRRNEVAFPIYEFTSQLANLEQPPPPEMQQLFAALRGNQADTDRFLGVLTGATPAPAFFAPENVGRIMGAAEAAV